MPSQPLRLYQGDSKRSYRQLWPGSRQDSHFFKTEVSIKTRHRFFFYSKKEDFDSFLRNSHLHCTLSHSREKEESVNVFHHSVLLAPGPLPAATPIFLKFKPKRLLKPTPLLTELSCNTKGDLQIQLTRYKSVRQQ